MKSICQQIISLFVYRLFFCAPCSPEIIEGALYLAINSLISRHPSSMSLRTEICQQLDFALLSGGDLFTDISRTIRYRPSLFASAI